MAVGSVITTATELVGTEWLRGATSWIASESAGPRLGAFERRARTRTGRSAALDAVAEEPPATGPASSGARARDRVSRGDPMTKLILQAIHPVFSLPEPDKGVGRIGPEVESPPLATASARGSSRRPPGGSREGVWGAGEISVVARLFSGGNRIRCRCRRMRLQMGRGAGPRRQTRGRRSRGRRGHRRSHRRSRAGRSGQPARPWPSANRRC